MNSDSTNTYNLHLLYRAGFGPSQQDLVDIAGLKTEEWLGRMFQESESFEPIDILNIDEVPITIGKAALRDVMKRRKWLKAQKDNKERLNHHWLMIMAHGGAPLREKMALFWHDHFACNVKHPYLVQRQINTIREHALGYFGDMLVAISKDPAMIAYLNNKQNIKINRMRTMVARFSNCSPWVLDTILNMISKRRQERSQVGDMI